MSLCAASPITARSKRRAEFPAAARPRSQSRRRASRRGVAASFALAVLLLAPRAALAGWSPEQLAAFADVVLIARVDDLRSVWDDEVNAIYTLVGLTVQQGLKGPAPTARVVLKQLGGRIGTTGLHVADQAAFQVGETVLLFLEARPRDGTLYTSALWQGKWTVEGLADGRPTARRHAPDGPHAGSSERWSLDLLERSVVEAAAMSEATVPIQFEPSADGPPAVDARVALAQSFTLLGPLRYLHSPIVDAQAGGQPGLAGGGIREILAAIGRWNNAGAAFQFHVGDANAAARCATDELGNGRVIISFMDPCGEMSDTGGTLAIGGSYYTSGGGSVNSEEFNRATEGFVITNNSETALRYLTTSGCFDDVLTHELGHVLGLGHSVDATAIMFPSINPGCVTAPRGLGPDDIQGITYIYGFRTGGRLGAPRVPPANVQVAVEGTERLTVSWSGDTAGDPAAAAATMYRLEFRPGHTEGGPILASFTTTTTSLVVAIPRGTVGDFNVVVIPANAEGGGPASPRTDFTICRAPAPVTGVTSQVSSGIARVAWQPSPDAVSYRIQAGSQPGLDDLQPITDIGARTAIEAAVAADFRGWARVFAVSGCGVSVPVDVLVERRD